MRYMFLIFCLTLFGLSNAYAQINTDQTAAPVNAANMGYEKSPVNKLGRGILNLSTFYLEVPASIMRVSKEKTNGFYGATVGTFQGFFTALYRGGVGLVDTVTFLAPPYNKPLMDPEYAIESMEDAER
jgi:putative exosortase-associated protein (TIGR04073 family)